MNETDKRILWTLAAGAGAWAAFRAISARARAYDLSGRVVLITGGSRGLGLLLAREFGERGAKLAICARDAEELKRAQLDLERRGNEVIAFATDVTVQSEVANLIDQVVECYGHIDVLINNAGIVQVGPVDTMTVDDYERAMRVHFWAPLFTTMAVLPVMRRHRHGRIVNISSIGGKIPVPHMLPYVASKFALSGFSEGLRLELAKEGILVTTAYPGLMRTGSTGNAEVKGDVRSEYTMFSIMGSLPVTSMNAKYAARKITDACQRGQAEVVLSPQAQLGERLHALAPGLTLEALALANHFMPDAGSADTHSIKGKDIRTPVSASWVTALNRQAAKETNQN